MSQITSIPAFLSIDVEPDRFQLPFRDPPQWPGYRFMFEYAERLRIGLAKRSGLVPQFGWYFRMDPQIAEVYGRADYAVTAFPDRIALLAARGDYFGVHEHPIRWCEQRHLWIHDFADARYVEHCVRSSLDAFSRWAGCPARRFRAGAGLLTNRIIADIDEQGVEVDLSLEPVAGWGLTASTVDSGIDRSPMIGTPPDCRTGPRVPYRPSRDNFLVRDGGRARNLVMIPHTTYPVGYENPSWRAKARRLMNILKPARQVAYLSLAWPSPNHYWDLIERQLRSMPQSYLSLGIRTDAPDSAIMAQVRSLLDALPHHPLADKLRFVDPLNAISDLV